MRMIFLLVTTSALSVAPWSGARAEVAITVGAMAIVTDMPYRDMKKDGELQAAPILAIDSKHLFFNTGILGVHLYSKEDDTGSLSLDAFVTHGGGYSRSDAPVLRGMRKRHAHTEAGLAATTGWALGQTLLSVQQDVSGRNDGLVANLSHSVPLPLGPVIFVPTVRLEYLSAGHVDYFFGVRTVEVRQDRPAYDGRYALNRSAGYLLIWPVTARWQVLHGVEASWLDKAVRESPLVGRDTRLSGFLGVTYTF